MRSKPPPNHHTSPALKKRTFMWLVGACGFSGCITTDTPIARNLPAGKLRIARGGGRRQLRTAHVRQRDAGALHHLATFLHGGDAAALQLAFAGRALPRIAQEAATHLLAKGPAQIVLQPVQVGEHLRGALFVLVHARHSMSAVRALPSSRLMQ